MIAALSGGQVAGKLKEALMSDHSSIMSRVNTGVQ